MSQIRNLLNRREFIQKSGLLGAGAAVTAAQANANLAKSLLGMGDAAVPAAVPGLDPRAFLPPGLEKGFYLPDGGTIVGNGKLAYLQDAGGAMTSVSKSQKDLIVKLLQEARDAMPKMPTEGVSQYNTLTKNWHQFMHDHSKSFELRGGGMETPFHALKAGESIPAGTPLESSWDGWHHPDDFLEFDMYSGSLTTPPARMLGESPRITMGGEAQRSNPFNDMYRPVIKTDPNATAITEYEREWTNVNRAALDYQRWEARQSGDPKAEQAHHEALHDLGLGGTARFDQPEVMQDTGEPTGLMGLPGSSQTNSHQTSANIRRMLGLGAAATAVGAGLSTQDAEAAPVRQLLAMDKASRMARAADMGLTTPAFHGTTHPFDEFRPSQANSGFWDGRPDQYAGTHFAKDRTVSENIVEMNRLKRMNGSNQQGIDPRVISAMLPDLAGMKAVPQLPARSGWGDEMVHPQEDTSAIRDFLLHEYYKSDPENLERAIAEASPKMTEQERRAVLEHLIGPDWQSYHAAAKQEHTNTFGKPYRETPRETRLESLGPDTYQEEAVQLDNLKKQRDEFALAQPGGRASDAWVDRPPPNVVLGRAVADRGVAALQKQGIRGLIYQNTNSPELGGFGNKPRIGTDPESYIVFDPANIRDERAAFDPSKRLSRNLMSSVAAATAAAAATAVGGAAAQAQGNSYPVISPEEAGVDQYFQENPQVSGMAWGGGMNGSDPESQRSIVLNPHSRLSPEQYKSVERNEGIRHQMNESGWTSDFEITPEQQAWAKQLGDYSANPAALRETIIARLASGDSVPAPTDEQQQIANTFAAPQTQDATLSPEQEYDFQQWYADAAAKAGLSRNPDDPEHYYNWRSAYLAGATPDEEMHWPSQFKHPDHPNRFVDGEDTITGEQVASEEPVLDSRTVDSASAQARDLRQEAGQNTVHQQSEPEFNQSGDVGDYIGNEPPAGAISGVSLRQYLAPEDKERDYSPRGMYARSVLNAMSQPVIQNPSSGEYLSMSEYVKQRFRADAMQRLGDTPMTDEVRERVQAAIEERASMAADNVGGVLAGTLRTNNQYTKDLATQVRSEVTRHAPGGDKALLGHRTQSEENTAQQEYGAESKHMLTADGQRNHQALAISELLNAQDTHYAPDTGLSHTARLIGSVVAPAYNMFTQPGGGGEHGWHLPRTTGEILDEDALFRKPDGRLEYAANLYTRSRDKSSASVYTPEGRPKHDLYNMQGITGVAAGTQENTTYPLAGWYQGSLGAASLGELATNMAAPGYRNNVAALRAATKRTTPVIPDGVAPEKVQQLSRQLGGATDKLQGWTSAYAGPKFADAANAVLGGKEVPRTYLSKAAEIATELPAQILGDPLNLIGTAAYPPLAAMRGGMSAATSGIRSMLGAGAVAGARSIPKAAVTVGDDLFQEAGTSAGLLATAGNLGQAFLPQKTNSLMGDINPNTPGFDQKLERNAIDQRMLQQDAAEQYAKMTGTYVPPKPKNPMSLPPTNWLRP